jgi:hypothetical protein
VLLGIGNKPLNRRMTKPICVVKNSDDFSNCLTSKVSLSPALASGIASVSNKITVDPCDFDYFYSNRQNPSTLEVNSMMYS